jgi:hypothetical protein
MNRLEEELRNAMRREEPPEGFAGRVLARVQEPKQSAWTGFFASSTLRWVLTGVMCLALAVAGIEYKRAQDERARGEAAKQQLMLALRITADKLQLAQEKVQQHSSSWTY